MVIALVVFRDDGGREEQVRRRRKVSMCGVSRGLEKGDRQTSNTTGDQWYFIFFQVGVVGSSSSVGRWVAGAGGNGEMNNNELIRRVFQQ